jgi:hypothetical protein
MQEIYDAEKDNQEVYSDQPTNEEFQYLAKNILDHEK